MKAEKFDHTGKKSGDVELAAGVFLEEFSKAAIYSVIRIENRNRRQGTHKTKGRAEVSGGGKKPWRQKGTGNARQGSTRAPQWRKGGTVFGPLPRDYSLKLPEKVRKNGLRSILSAKAVSGSVKVLNALKMDSFSTKNAYGVFKNMGLLPGNTVCFLDDTEDLKVKKSLMNIPGIQFVHVRRMTAPEMYYAGQIVISESAMKFLEENYADSGKKKGEVA